MKNYSDIFKNTPQTKPIPGRTDMVKNNAGGFGFTISSQERLERFLTIGSETGTYYVNETNLTVENAEQIINYIKADGQTVLNTVIDFAATKRAPKSDPGIFVLALLASFGTPEVKKSTYAAIKTVCKTGTHLFMFVANVQNLRGWSRGLRTGVAEWYTSKEKENLEYQVVKYRNRSGFTHRDLLRLAHPVSKPLNTIFKYLVGKSKGPKNSFIAAFEEASKSEGKELVSLIKEYRLTWEMVPTEQLNTPAVLEALLENMPLHALLRNLNRFATAGLTTGVSETTKKIVARFGKTEVTKAGLHPVTILNAMRVYAQGRGELSSKTWTPNQNIVDALDVAYYTAIESLVPTNKSILVAVDISGSMSHETLKKSALTSRDVAAALSMSIMRSEPNSELVWFDTKVYAPNIGRRSSLQEILQKTPNGGGTDCSLALKYAIHTKNKYDAIVILTDSETWAGNSHAVQELNEYRKINPNVKVIEVGMVATRHSVLATDNDKNVLRVVGFDSTVVEVINKFI